MNQKTKTGTFGEELGVSVFFFFLTFLVEFVDTLVRRHSLVKITQNLTENTRFLIKRDYLRVKKCYSFLSLGVLR